MNTLYEILIKLMLLIVILVVVWGLKELISFIKEKTKGTKYEKLVSFVEKAVLWAEQIITGTKLGEEKKYKVLGLITTYISKQGVDISNDELDALIEAAVKTMNSNKTNNKLSDDEIKKIIKIIYNDIDDTRLNELTKQIGETLKE